MDDKIKCEFISSLEADVHVTFGMYKDYKEGIPHNKINLSKKAAHELWQECKVLVNLGEMHWVNKPIETKD